MKTTKLLTRVAKTVICAFAIVAGPQTVNACPDIDGLLDINCDGKLTIAAFGDSITFGRGSETGFGYPDYLNALLPNAQVSNLGVPGENTYSGRSRAGGAFASVGASDFVIVLEGVNDYHVANKNSYQTRDNVLDIFNIGRSGGAIGLLGNLTDIKRPTQRDWVMLVNRRFLSLKDIDFFALGQGIISVDKIHPNALGYQTMANLILQSLQLATLINRPADSDGDGIYDFAEAQFGSNPAVADSDGDGLLDGAEVFVHGSSPIAIDTDGDGFSDEQEVNSFGSNPADPRPTAPTMRNLEILIP